jgi:hypothetical protein
MSTSGKSNNNKKAQFPVSPFTTPDDEERTSKGKITAKQKGLKWTKNVPDFGKVYMPTKRDDSHMVKDEVGFLGLGHAEPTHAYDVGGEWKLLYKKNGDDEQDDKPIGPGMKPRNRSKSPPPPPSLASPKKSPTPKKTNKNRSPKRSPKKSPKPRPKPTAITSTHAVPPPPLPTDPTMDIVVRCWNGTMFYLRDVTPEDTIEDVQLRIKREHDIPIENQRLRFVRQPLSDPDKTLKEYNIQDQSMLDLDPMQINFRDPYKNVRHILDVNPTDTIDDVKEKIFDKTGIPKKNQRLNFNKQPLLEKDDDKTLNDCGINHGDMIDLQPMELTVKAPDGRTINLVVSPDDTINDIKKQVNEKLDIPFVDQRPTFKGKSLPDNSTLGNNNIGHGDTINLQPMELAVKAPGGRTVNLVVSPDDTIEDIKKQVNEKLLIPVDDQRMTFKDNSLPDKSTLRNNNIGHGDTIDLQPMLIYVIDLDGNKGTYTVDSSDKIKSIKILVNDDTGVPKAQQRLTFKGTLLDDDISTLKDNGIKHKDTLRLEPFKIHIRLPQGNTITLDVDPENSTNDVKDMIKKREGILPKDQILSFDDTKLDDKTKLKDNNVQHDDTIDLTFPPPPPPHSPPKPKLKLVAPVPTKPEKSSYLPWDWKDQQDRYGSMTVTTYKTRYDGEPGETFIDEVIKTTTKFKVDERR